MKLVSFVIAASALVASTVVTSQEAIPPMRILINKFDDDARKCGLSEARVEAAIRSAMRYNRVEVSATETNPLAVVVQSNIVRPSGICAGNLNLKIRSFKTADFGEREILAVAEFCFQSAIFSHSSNLEANVLPWLKTAFDSCLADIDKYEV